MLVIELSECDEIPIPMCVPKLCHTNSRSKKTEVKLRALLLDITVDASGKVTCVDDKEGELPDPAVKPETT